MSKEQKADWKGFDWNGAENCELRKYVSSLEIQLAKVTRERDEAQAREAAVIDRLKAEIAKCQWCGGKGTYTDTIGENTYSGKCIHCEPYQDMLATLQDPSHACDVWKAMKAELEARREVMTQMCFNEGYGDQAQFDAAWAKLEKARAALEEVTQGE